MGLREEKKETEAKGVALCRGGTGLRGKSREKKDERKKTDEMTEKPLKSIRGEGAAWGCGETNWI